MESNKGIKEENVGEEEPKPQFSMEEIRKEFKTRNLNVIVPPRNERDQAIVINYEVINLTKKKPFLGGFRHKDTGVEFHNASAQTRKKKKKQKFDHSGKVVQKFHRDTQTIKTKTRSCQTYREQGTQMEKPGLVLDNSGDRVVMINEKPYFNAEEYSKLVVQKVIRIQSFFRGYMARKRARKLRGAHEGRLMKEKEEEEERKRMELEKKQKDMYRRKYPKTGGDFEVLYQDLESWKMKNVMKINEKSKTEEERKARLYENLRKETKILQTIDRLKIKSNKENQVDRINKKLQRLARPKRIKGKGGTVVEIETPLTVRSRELMDLYHGLNTVMLSIDERLDVLLHVKWTVKEFDCKLTRDIVELIDREADLLNRGRKNKSLTGLRKRLSNLFLEFVECPEFNPVTKRLKNSNVKYINTRPLKDRMKKRYY